MEHSPGSCSANASTSNSIQALPWSSVPDFRAIPSTLCSRMISALIGLLSCSVERSEQPCSLCSRLWSRVWTLDSGRRDRRLTLVTHGICSPYDLAVTLTHVASHGTGLGIVLRPVGCSCYQRGFEASETGSRSLSLNAPGSQISLAPFYPRLSLGPTPPRRPLAGPSGSAFFASLADTQHISSRYAISQAESV